MGNQHAFEYYLFCWCARPQFLVSEIITTSVPVLKLWCFPSPWTTNHTISNQTTVPCSDKITAVQIQSLSSQTQIIPQSLSSKFHSLVPGEWHDYSDPISVWSCHWSWIAGKFTICCPPASHDCSSASQACPFSVRHNTYQTQNPWLFMDIHGINMT